MHDLLNAQTEYYISLSGHTAIYREYSEDLIPTPPPFSFLLTVQIFLTLSYLSEGSPALAVFRPHHL
jgi:hypothetical protein